MTKWKLNTSNHFDCGYFSGKGITFLGNPFIAVYKFYFSYTTLMPVAYLPPIGIKPIDKKRREAPNKNSILRALIIKL